MKNPRSLLLLLASLNEKINKSIKKKKSGLNFTQTQIMFCLVCSFFFFFIFLVLFDIPLPPSLPHPAPLHSHRHCFQPRAIK
jgi:Kef-type K+ transport system membrane component KefB